MELPKTYNAKDYETKIYEKWEASGFFHPETMIQVGLTEPDARTFTIMLPPPNATGVLHMGHALMISWQDLLIRFNRMRGCRTLWLPGTDHAAIATQAKVEKDIAKKEKKSRYDLGRDELLRRIDAYVEASRHTIQTQTRRLGASCDWQREAFTLDEPRSLAVRTIFSSMYRDGLIYRGQRIVNWDPRGQTTISDDELIYEERPTTLYTFRYSPDVPIPIATTRPETKVGDTAIAVHPDDERFAAYVGQIFDVEFCGVPLHLRVIADPSVDPNFGTGAVGVTPAHSQIDWDMADRHGLDRPQVINEKARIMVDAPTLKEKKVTEAREVVVDWLRDNELLEKEETITHNIATAERTGGVIEPLPKLQWFVDVNKKFTLAHSEIPGIKSGAEMTLKDLMRAAVAEGGIRITPTHAKKVYLHWIDNLRDWCISRQIWYGHRIPVWYRNSKSKTKSQKLKVEEEIYVGVEPPTGDGWTQDEDTLDTWFSAGLWTFSTLGWPETTVDLKSYHPTTLIQPGTEILFFWVARMILMTGYALGQIPFRTVLLNGIVRDEQGRKFSKSLGNGREPIEMADEYGADAIRLYFYITATPGTDSRLHEDKMKGYKHFTNKLWNVARFILMNLEESQKSPNFAKASLGRKVKSQNDNSKSQSDAKILTELDEITSTVTKAIEEYRFHIAAETLYHYVWHTLADKILEDMKPRLAADADPVSRSSAQAMLLEILVTVLKLLHPFMPFVTEAIWQELPAESKNHGLLMVTKWPATRLKVKGKK